MLTGQITIFRLHVIFSSKCFHILHPFKSFLPSLSVSLFYRDSMKAVMCLYNQVEDGVHTLVMRSNQSLQHLDHMLLLRETEEQLNTVRQQTL